MQFADVKNDVAFRKIFGDEKKTEILISFLNAILHLNDKKRIVSVTILNPYQPPLIIGAKSTVLDVRAIDQRGNEYIIEMQVTDKMGFAKRVVYYSAKSYVSQLEVGEDYFKLKSIIFIGILNFDFLENKNFLSRHLILDAKTYEHKLKDFDFNFIELPKFNLREDELNTMVDKWIYFIKNAENLLVIPSGVDDKGLLSAYQQADRHTWTKEELEEYEYAQMRETDEKAEKMIAVENKQKEIARNLINLGSDNEFISKATNLSMEQVEEIHSEMK